MAPLHLPRSHRGLLALGAAATLVGGAAAYKKVRVGRADDSASDPRSTEDDLEALGWGAAETPEEFAVPRPDGARLAVWEVGSGPAVVMPHSWGGSHAIWIPVARRLLESGHRVVLYDQRGHGSSSRGTAPLSMATLADDLAAVLESRALNDVVLAGHSMGGMTVMSLAAYRPEVLAQRARAIVLVSTAAADMGAGPPGAERFAAGLITLPAVSMALRAAGGHRFVRGAFGVDPVRAHLDLTRRLLADSAPLVRAGFLSAISTMNLLEGIATIGIPTTVMVGSRDRITAPVRSEQLARAIPGARLVIVPDRGHMLPLEDPDAVAEEIGRSTTG